MDEDLAANSEASIQDIVSNMLNLNAEGSDDEDDGECEKKSVSTSDAFKAIDDLGWFFFTNSEAADEHIKAIRDLEKHQNYVYTFQDYKETILEKIRDFDRISGVKFHRFSALNKFMKGLRPGEITILTGHTGLGKTTFMSEYSLDLIEQGVETLWVNLEVPNSNLIITMMTQFARKSLLGNVEEYEKVSTDFNCLPIFFLDLNNEKLTLDEVLNVIGNAVKSRSVSHLVVDNMQCFLNLANVTFSGFDYLKTQDQIFGSLRDIAAKNNCHVTIVIHPRKESTIKELHNSSIAGTGMAIQQSHNILIMQSTSDGSARYLELTKNRYDGDKGTVSLEFQKSTLTYTMQVQETLDL
ncbi:Twinkle protein, mitochondrial [Araneus ventricosus]|uniref:Twinkle protein, mitochondrial n=1 Tax=Araneus ventricosus TaxID=182803 RepID=A0A4Y2NN98_ARAVE|nr:Twinkle protein, mitochondrial [Araneus ventricosus]